MAPRWTLFLLVWLAPTSGEAQRLPVEVFTTADGLGSNVVYRIVRDSRGYIWFCTREGLSRFDGHRFVTYGVEQGLPSAVVHDFLETRQGDLWLATRGGLVRFDPLGEPTTGTAGVPPRRAIFTTYTTGRQSPAGSVSALLQDRSGVLWVGTWSGLYRLEERDGGAPRLVAVDLGIPQHLDDRLVHALLEDSSGALWVGTSSGLYRLAAGGPAERYLPAAGDPVATVHSLLQDRRGDLWIGTRSGGLVRLTLDPATGRPVDARVYSTTDGLPDLWINDLFQASDGGLWAGSNAGLLQLVPGADGAEYRFRAYGVAQGLPRQVASGLAEDRSGNLWVGVPGGGAVRMAASGFTIFDAGDGLTWATSLFATRHGDLIAVGGRSPAEWSLFGYTGEHLVATGIAAMRERATWGWNQTVLVDHTGDWWIASKQGVLRYSGVGAPADLARAPPRFIYTMRDGLAADVVLRLFEDSRGDVWIGTVGHGERPNGLTRWRRGANRFDSFTERDGTPSLEDYYVSSFAEDRAGNVWIGFSGDGGVVRFHDGAFARFTLDHGVPAGALRNLLIDSRGRLWGASLHGGLVRCDDPGAGLPRFTRYTTTQGLSSNEVHAVVEDGRGQIYIATARGIDRLDPATDVVRPVSAVAGLAAGEPQAALADRQGALWFSYPTSLVRLEPQDAEPPAPPATLITGARIAGRSVPVSALGQAVVEHRRLPAGQGQVEIEFVAPGSGPGAAWRYQVWLEGTDATWDEPSDHQSIRYASLAPGAYRFHVRAVNADRMAGDAASFTFTILPPLWQRWWFVLLAALAVTSVAAGLYRYRVGRLLEMANLRTRIATDLHDDIGANLTRIAVLSEVGRQRARPGGEPVDRGLASIAELARESVTSLGEIVWAIHPERDRLEDLTRKMREYAEDVLAVGSVELQFDAPEGMGGRRIGLGVRRDLFLVFKEAIRNAARHSGCSRIEVALRADAAAVRLEIHDDGTGFDPQGRTEGHGLLSMRRRAERLGAELTVVSSPGAGTTVQLAVPLGVQPGRRWGSRPSDPTHRSR